MMAIRDECTVCKWLNEQPENNEMFCTRPGECFWTMPIKGNPKTQEDKNYK